MKVMNQVLAATVLMGAASLPALAVADDKDDGSTVVQLSAEARRVVTEDRLKATLNIEKTAKTAAEAQADVNARMQAAKAIYSELSSVKATTGGYNVWKQYTPEPAPKRDGSPAWTPAEREKNAYWQANQQLILDGSDKDTLLKLVSTLQGKGFAVQGLDFYLSRDASDALRDELEAEALGKIKQRAEKLAKVLDFKTIRYSRIDLGGDVPPGRPVPMMARAMMKSDVVAEAAPDPVAQAGESEVVVNVTAEVKMAK